MKSKMSLIVLFLLGSFVFPQPSVEDAWIDAAIEHHGGRFDSVALTGQTEGSDGNVAPFSLVVAGSGNKMQFQSQKGEQPVEIVSDGSRSRILHESGRSTRDPSRFSLSPLNYSPLFALLRVADDPHQIVSLVESQEGAVGIRFEQTDPPLIPPPPFPQPKPVITFWVDGQNTITQVDYEDSLGHQEVLSYRYIYSTDIRADGMVQPIRIEKFAGGREVSITEVSGAQTDVSIPSDFFEVN